MKIYVYIFQQDFVFPKLNEVEFVVCPLNGEILLFSHNSSQVTYLEDLNRIKVLSLNFNEYIVYSCYKLTERQIKIYKKQIGFLDEII